MSYDCTCGDDFDTLTEYRLHQRDECPDRDADLDIGDQDLDETVEQVVQELLICDVCAARNGGAEEIQRETTAAGLSITLTFECANCGGWNENTAILSGGGSA